MAFDPSPFEQEMLQLLNRTRVDPVGEFARLIPSTSPVELADPAIEPFLDFFEVDLDLLKSQTDALTPVAPVAWNAQIRAAAEGHSLRMIAEDAQEHVLPGEPGLEQRIRDAGYVPNYWGENIYAYCVSAIMCHAGFFIDWGDGPGGIQSPPGHRDNMVRSQFEEVGIAAVEETDPTTAVGPQVVTVDFGRRDDGPVQSLGAVYDDLDGDGWYDSGEGLGGVTVVFAGSAGRFETLSMTAGGYQLPLPAGTYTATATGGALGDALLTQEVVIADENVWLNFSTLPSPPTAVSDRQRIETELTASIEVLANDLAAPGAMLDAASVELQSATTGGVDWTIDSAAGNLTVTAVGALPGIYHNRYRVQDDAGRWSNWTDVSVFAVEPGVSAYHNATAVYDTDDSGSVTPLDALLVINDLNRRGGPQQLPQGDGPDGAWGFVDVNGNGIIEPIDALRIINELNRLQGSAEPEAMLPEPDAFRRSVAGLFVADSTLPLMFAGSRR